MKLGEVCHNLANVKEALTQKFDQASDRNLAGVKTPYAEKSQYSGSAETSVLTSVPRDKRTHQRVVKGFAAHKETARKCVWSETEEVKVYLGGYLISWSIEFTKHGDDLILCLVFRLHKGDDDEFLEWPFKKALKLSIIHPETGQELHRYSGSSWIDSFKHCLEKPSNDGNTGIRFLKMNFSASELENEGYVKSDQVWLRLEVGR